MKKKFQKTWVEIRVWLCKEGSRSLHNTLWILLRSFKTFFSWFVSGVTFKEVPLVGDSCTTTILFLFRSFEIRFSLLVSMVGDPCTTTLLFLLRSSETCFFQFMSGATFNKLHRKKILAQPHSYFYSGPLKHVFPDLCLVWHSKKLHCSDIL